jgi:predicted GNAT superfamily acetyltransferase
VKIPINSTLADKSVDNIIYRELYTDDDFNQCINLQRSIFKIPDTHLISPLFFKLIARKNPPLGISVGVFKNDELIGFTVGFSTFIENSIYVTIMGVKEEYQNKIYGFKLSLKFREIAINNGLTQMFCVFDPLSENLARLYCSKLGFVGYKFELDNNSESENLYIPEDKLTIRWNFNAENTINKISGKHFNSFDDIIQTYPIAQKSYQPEFPKILVEIPGNFDELKRYDIKKALELSLEFRLLLSEYINTKSYLVTDCITGKIQNKRKSYYLLEKL